MNLTDGGDPRFFVFVDALEDSMDLAGAGREAVEDMEDDLSRLWNTLLCDISPRIETGRSQVGLELSPDQYGLPGVSSSDALLLDSSVSIDDAGDINGISGKDSRAFDEFVMAIYVAKGSLSANGDVT